MRIKSISAGFARAESGRSLRTINIEMLGSVKVGDYVIVHAGFAIEKVDPQRAKETLRLIDEIR